MRIPGWRAGCSTGLLFLDRKKAGGSFWHLQISGTYMGGTGALVWLLWLGVWMSSHLRGSERPTQVSLHQCLTTFTCVSAEAGSCSTTLDCLYSVDICLCMWIPYRGTILKMWTYYCLVGLWLGLNSSNIYISSDHTEGTNRFAYYACDMLWPWGLCRHSDS